MRQTSKNHYQGKNAIAPPSDAQLNELASDLAGIHPSDLNTLLKTLCEFGWLFYPEAKNSDPSKEPLEGLPEVLELAHTLWIVYPGEAKAMDGGERFVNFLSNFGRLLDLAYDYFFTIQDFAADQARSNSAQLVCVQIERIAANLGTERDALPCLDPLAKYSGEVKEQMGGFIPGTVRRWYHGIAAPAAAICVALLLWDISSDHLPLWQIIAAIGLVLAICGAAFRLGQRLQTPVSLSARRT